VSSGPSSGRDETGGPAPLPNPYDDVPYISRPHADSHPDHLAALAALMGLAPAPAARCRVLELGCAQGGNLAPLAVAYPGSTFIGLDGSQVQIEQGRERWAATPGLENLHLLCADLRTLDHPSPPVEGPFDYILCHGVWSWVPPEVQRAILSGAGRLLAPHGVLYLSYNLLPGWYERLPFRDLMRFHARGTASGTAAMARARQILTALGECVPDDLPHAAVARAFSAHLLTQDDAYLFHEYLAPVNRPVPFTELLQRAGAAGLQYLCEAEFHSMVPSNVSAALAQRMPELVCDRVGAEQLTDFVRNRSFRKTLLVPAAARLRTALDGAALEGLRFTGRLRPQARMGTGGVLPLPFALDPLAPAPMVFEGERGSTIEGDTPLSRAALLALWRAQPASLSWDDLLAGALQEIGEAPDADHPAHAPSHRDDLGHTLLAALSADLLRLRHGPDPFVTRPSPQPRACPLARAQAARGLEIPSRRHVNLALEAADRALLRALDGSRDHEALAEALAESPEERAAMLRRLPGALARLGELGLLVDGPLVD